MKKALLNKSLWSMLSLQLILDGCSIPLNKEYDARIIPPNTKSLNLSGSLPMIQYYKFTDTSINTFNLLPLGYSYSRHIPTFMPFSEHLQDIEIGFGGVPLPFIFSGNVYIKYNPIKLPTHTFVSAFIGGNFTGWVAAIDGYSFRRGIIATQEVYWSNKSSVAISTGIMYRNEETNIYGSEKTDNSPDHATREASGTYMPISFIGQNQSYSMQISYNHCLDKYRRYYLSVYPDPRKEIQPVDADERNQLTITMSYHY